MKFLDDKVMDKPIQTFMDGALLALLEYILIEGVDGALEHFSDISTEDVKSFPHVAKALQDKGFIKGE